MKYRNAKYNEFGTIDCEIEHPDFGWIPFTADHNDVEEHGKLIATQVQADHDNPQSPVVIAAYVEPEPVVINATIIHQYDFVEWAKTNNKLDDLETLINSSAENRLKWSAAVNLRIDDPLIVALAPSLGITDLQATFNEIG